MSNGIKDDPSAARMHRDLRLHMHKKGLIQKSNMAEHKKETLKLMAPTHFSGSIMDHTENKQESIIESGIRPTPPEWNNINSNHEQY